MITIRIFFSALAALVIAGCATTSGKRPYVAPTDQTVTGILEQGHGTSPLHVIYVENLSTVPITVTSVTLRVCENIKQPCNAPFRKNVRVLPSHRSVVQRVEPRNPNQSFGFGYSFAWRPEPGTVASLEGGEGSLEISDVTDDPGPAAVAGDAFLEAADIEALRDRVAGIRVEPDSLVMSMGETLSLDRVHVILVDTAGQRLGRVRQVRWQFVSGAFSFTPPDTLRATVPGRTEIHATLPETALRDRADPLGPAMFVVIVR
jgi:hypothetical protein